MTPTELFHEAMRRTDAGDIDGFVALHAPDCTWITPQGPVTGHGALRAWLSPWTAGFPDGYRHELSHVAEAGGTVYAEGTFNGVNSGPMETPQGTLPATDRPLALRFAIHVATADGLLSGVRLYFDQMEFLGQLGLLPEPAAAG
jgi:ketosteroid isomerase-like protein